MALPDAQGPAPLRSVGRPKVVDSGQGSLAAILNLVRTGAATTRQDLERSSELGRAVISDRLATLTGLGLIEEGELAPSAGGRAPRQVRLKANAGRILAAVIEPSALSVGLADLTGRLASEHHESIEVGAGAEEVLDRLVTLFTWLIEDQAEQIGVWSIGLALPAPLKPEGDPFVMPRIGGLQAWAGFPFLERLALQFAAPVWAQGMAQVMTMGELKAGAGRGESEILFVHLGRTVTAGLVSRGRLHVGAQGAAGMVGINAVDDSSLDAIAGAEVIAQAGVSAAQEGRSPLLAAVLERTGEVAPVDVGHAAQAGEAAAMEILTRAGRAVGEVLAPLVNLTNPAVIVLAGPVSQAGDALLAAIREAIYRQSHPVATRDLRIVRSQMGSSAGLVGAAQLATECLFDPAILAGWVTRGAPTRHPRFTELLGQWRFEADAREKANPPRSASTRTR